MEIASLACAGSVFPAQRRPRQSIADLGRAGRPAAGLLLALHPAVVGEAGDIDLLTSFPADTRDQFRPRSGVAVCIFVRADRTTERPCDGLVKGNVRDVDDTQAEVAQVADHVSEPPAEPVVHHNLDDRRVGAGELGKRDRVSGQQHGGGACPGARGDGLNCQIGGGRIVESLPVPGLALLGGTAEPTGRDRPEQPFPVPQRCLVLPLGCRSGLQASYLQRLQRGDRPLRLARHRISALQIIQDHPDAGGVGCQVRDNRYQECGNATADDHRPADRPFAVPVECLLVIPAVQCHRGLQRVSVTDVSNLEQRLTRPRDYLLRAAIGSEPQPGAQRIVPAHHEPQVAGNISDGAAGRQRHPAANAERRAVPLHDRQYFQLAPGQLAGTGALTFERHDNVLRQPPHHRHALSRSQPAWHHFSPRQGRCP